MSHEPVWLADVILFQVYDWKLKSWHSVECLLCGSTPPPKLITAPQIYPKLETSGNKVVNWDDF